MDETDEDWIYKRKIVNELYHILNNFLQNSGVTHKENIEYHIVLFFQILCKLPDCERWYDSIMKYYAKDYQRDIFNRYLNKKIKTTLEAL